MNSSHSLFCRLTVASLVLLFSHGLYASAYFVDFEKGDDTRTGQTAETAWKHAPGDANASGNAASVKLAPGDVVQFRAGVVYRGGMKIPASGTPGAQITYRGTGWGEGRALLDGSELVTGWRKCVSAKEAGDNPKFAALYYAEVQADSPFLLNLHEFNSKTKEDEFLWIAQDPNPKDPFFHDRPDSFHPLPHNDLTTTSLVSKVFTSPDPNHYKEASILLWVNPNWTKRLKILSYEPAAHKITFEDIGKNAIYPDRDQSFAIYNSADVIGGPGEYFVSEPDANGKRRILLWPRSPEDLDRRISRSVCARGIDIARQNYITVEGFDIQKYAGEDVTGGCGIGTSTRGGGKSAGLLIRNNFITHCMCGVTRGVGAIFLDDATNSVVENNVVIKNKNHRGIFINGVENVIVRKNRIEHTGATALGLYSGKKIQILDNDISHIHSTHANGITIYIASENVLVAGNRINDTTTPITFQDSGPLYFINNFTDGGGQYKNVNEWINTHRGPWALGDIVFINNTFLNAEKHCSLNLGKDPQKKYVIVNNLLDGLTISDKKSAVENDHNILTGAGSGAGVDVSKYYPKNAFPEVDFNKIGGVTVPMKIGAIMSEKK